MSNIKRKKILYVITKSNWGGAQRYVYDLAFEISRKKSFDVSVVFGGNGILEKKLVENKISTTQITPLKRDVNLLNDFKVFFELISIFKKEKPDIIHLNSSKIGIIGSLAGRIARSKTIIFTAHGWAHTEDRPSCQKLIIKTLHWLTILLSHKTITVSEKTKSEILNMPFVKNKLKVIYNGITEPNFYEREISREEIAGENKRLPNSSFVIGTIAELHKNKGLSYAIEAFSKILEKKKLTDIYFVIIGSGDEKKKLNNLVKQKNIEKHVIFFESNNASKYLKAFDIFILPSIKEGLPYTILEAGFAKLPVIVSNVGGTSEIIEHEKNGFLIQPRDMIDLERKLELLLHDKTLRISLGEKLYNQVKISFSIQNMVNKTLLCYQTQK